MTVYEYWYFWTGTLTHPAPELEPVYIYWKTTNPTAPSLLAVYTRFHFLWRQTGGAGLVLNGTQIVVSFGIDTTLGRWHFPLVRSTGFFNLFKSSNQTLSIPYSQTPSIGSVQWYYPLTNGGPHSQPVIVDPNSPYCCWYGNPPPSGFTNNPIGYENDAAGNAGPADPFTLYGTGRNYQLGFLTGLVVTLATFFLFSVALFEERRLVKWLRRNGH